MRILIFQEDHPTVKGGADSWANDTARGLKLCGHEVAWLKGRNVKGAMEKFKPDVVLLGTIHCFIGLEAAEWLSRQGIPAAWFMHDYWCIGCQPRMLMRDNNHSDQGCEAVTGVCRNSCGYKASLPEIVNRFYVVTGCEGAAEIMRRNGVNVRAVVEEGVDTELFKPAETKKPPNVVYCHAAGPEMWKGIHVLKEAVAGTNLELSFWTNLNREHMADVLSKASVYAFPSVYQEIWGLALTEAMASGCAVVASDVTGARAQIDQCVTGILIPPGDPVALRAQLLALASADAWRREMGLSAREHVERDHSLEAIGRRWTALFEVLLKEEAA